MTVIHEAALQIELATGVSHIIDKRARRSQSLAERVVGIGIGKYTSAVA
jgi:hypothetical protein